MSTAGVFTGICEPDNHKCAGDGNHCYHGYNPGSTSALKWGTNSSLPYATNVNQTFVTNHLVVLPLLQAGPLYYVAAVSTDNSGSTQSSAITFSLCGSPLVSVQGTVNNYYQYGSFTMAWVPPAGASQSPTVCGQPVTTTVAGLLDGGSSFNTQIADASKVVPGPGQWQVIATDAGNLAPVTVYAYLSQQSQNVSQQLQAAAASAGLQACITNTQTDHTYPSSCGGSGGTVPGGTLGAIQWNSGPGTFAGAVISGPMMGNGTSAPSAATSAQLAAGLNTSPSTLLATALLPEATGTTFGTIKPDGTSCMVSSGVLSCPGSGGITALTGDVTASGTGSVAATVKGINGTTVSSLASGLYFNTTSTGVPSIATSPQVVTALNTSPSTTLAAALFPAFTGDVTTTAGTVATTTKGINGTTISGLASGIYYNTTSTGALSIATSPQVVTALNTSPSSTLAVALLPAATSSTLGAIKPDNVSCTVSAGILACTGSGGGITTLTGDVNASGSGSVASTVKGINGTIVSSLASGLYFNTTSTGVPSIATSPQVVTALNASPSTTLATALLPVATGSAFGTIKPDGTSCTVTAGVLSCPGSGGGITALTGDVTASGTGSVAATVKGINGTTVSSLASGLYYNTTSTGVPSIATSTQVVTALNTSPSATITSALLPVATGSAFGIVKPDGTTITISGGVISASGGGGGGNLTGSLSSPYIPVATGTTTLTNSLLQDSGTTLSYSGSGGISLTGTTPGKLSVAAGTGSILALPSNSQGFAAATCGTCTAYLIGLPGTITAGYPILASPTTVAGVNQALMTVGHIEFTVGATGAFAYNSSPEALAQATALNNAHFTKLTVTNVVGSCTTAPTFNVFDTASNTGTAITASTSQQLPGTASTAGQTLAITAGDLYGVEMTNSGSSCGATFSVVATVEEP